MILDHIEKPQDLKKLSLESLEELANEIRKILIYKIDKTGGHMGPNLGFIEATIALHTVFDAPLDKIVYDVSHQCYTHKILTGRKASFLNPDQYDEISGFTAPKESPYDLFQIGHTSTGVSLATGLAKARDIKGESYNVIAVVGDGSLSGGEAFEGLDNASVLGSNFIIVVNDNEMSIAENQGGLYQNLALLRRTKGTADNNFFKTLGFDYKYVEDGHNLKDLIDVFRSVKDTTHPVVVHLHTQKGKGLLAAEQNKERFHYILPGLLSNQKTQKQKEAEDYTSFTAEWLLKRRQIDSSLVVLTAGTPGATGFTPLFREQMGKQYVDVGICEPQAIAMSSGLAAGGAHPVFAVLSSFIQRTYDQLSQDLALNRNPATILVYWSGLSSADATHLGCFDIPLIANIPNMVYLAPVYKEEYEAMLSWSIKQREHPVAIRVPFGPLVSIGKPDETDYSVLNKFSVVRKGKQVALIAEGDFFERGKDIQRLLKEHYGLEITLINPKFLSGLDTQLLSSLKADHKVVVTLENGVLEGGFGEKIARFYASDKMRVLNYGLKKEFTDRMPVSEILKHNRLIPELIVEDIHNLLSSL